MNIQKFKQKITTWNRNIHRRSVTLAFCQESVQTVPKSFKVIQMNQSHRIPNKCILNLFTNVETEWRLYTLYLNFFRLSTYYCWSERIPVSSRYNSFVAYQYTFMDNLLLSCNLDIWIVYILFYFVWYRVFSFCCRSETFIKQFWAKSKYSLRKGSEFEAFLCGI